ncbi:unnamed protein product [Medioppia subpectinata]|uniref:Caspase family p20 domain-containing protein n=1 Tax=Medioppia subpectinata TaxID=1979941 RepID=A0A7R9Q1B1_9ACAR|nr:unnamed protein product [Medioppia subpectinata]CAG2108111.1 unnamed protein product [Medioppia subpectinata]
MEQELQRKKFNENFFEFIHEVKLNPQFLQLLETHPCKYMLNDLEKFKSNPTAQKCRIFSEFTRERNNCSLLAQMLEDSDQPEAANKLREYNTSEDPWDYVNTIDLKVVPAITLRSGYSRWYTMDGRQRGRALIFVTIDVLHKEAQRFESILKQMYFNVEIHSLLKCNQIEAVLNTAAEYEHKGDAFIVMFIGHGGDEKIKGYGETPGDELAISKIVDKFSERKCSSLRNKPKVFVFNCCRTNEPTTPLSAVKIGSRIVIDMDTIDRNWTNENQRTYIVYSCAEGIPSWYYAMKDPNEVHPFEGFTQFGQAFSHTIAQFSWYKPLAELLQKTIDREEFDVRRSGYLNTNVKQYKTVYSTDSHFYPRVKFISSLDTVLRELISLSNLIGGIKEHHYLTQTSGIWLAIIWISSHLDTGVELLYTTSLNLTSHVLQFFLIIITLCALGTYNSLNDPHLHQYFRKPKVRNHLIQAGLSSQSNHCFRYYLPFTCHLISYIKQLAVKPLKRSVIIEGFAFFDDHKPDLLLSYSSTQFYCSLPFYYGLRHQSDSADLLLSAFVNVVNNSLHDLSPLSNRLGLQRLHETRTLESEAKWELVQRAKIAFESSQSNTATTGVTTRTQSNSSGITKKSAPSGPTSMSWLRRVAQIKPKLFTNRRRRVRVNALNRYERPKSSYGIRSSNKVKPDLQTETELNEQFSDILSLDGLSIHDTDDEEYDKRRSGLWSSKKAKPSIITLRFNGLTANCLIPRRVQISQQLYSGGNAITIFDRMVSPGEKLTFSVRPHGDSPFSMTVLIDGIRDLRVSTCCEHKHRIGSKISHFTLVDVSGGKMCANCKKNANRLTKSLSTGAMGGAFQDTEPINNGKHNETTHVTTNNENNNMSDSDVEDAEQTVIELEKKSSRSSSPINGDNNDDQFETYESEFETETPESTRMRSNSISSSDNSTAGHQEIVEVEVHTNH